MQRRLVEFLVVASIEGYIGLQKPTYLLAGMVIGGLYLAEGVPLGRFRPHDSGDRGDRIVTAMTTGCERALLGLTEQGAA